jgi:Uma2 family endonuclease
MAGAARDRVDRTFYPVVEKVGESSLQRFIVELLRPMIERWLADRGEPTFVGADQFVYYEQFDPKQCVSPDIYVMPGVPPQKAVGCWKAWEPNSRPSLAIEVVSTAKRKDYAGCPPRYDALGIPELIVFDPEPKASGVLFQVFRRMPRRGLVRVEATNGDRVRSRVLGCWLRAVGEGEAMRLVLATGPRGEHLVPTLEERVEAEHAAREAERAARERVEAELAELKEQLRRQNPTKR